MVDLVGVDVEGVNVECVEIKGVNEVFLGVDVEGVSVVYVEGVDAGGVNIVDLEGVDMEGVFVDGVDAEVCTLYNTVDIVYRCEVFVHYISKKRFSFQEEKKIKIPDNLIPTFLLIN